MKKVVFIKQFQNLYFNSSPKLQDSSSGSSHNPSLCFLKKAERIGCKKCMVVKDQDFVEYIVKSIVSSPNDVRVERTVDERGVLLTLHINPQDMGYVIGRQGQTAHAIRTLAKIVGARNNARVHLKIYEPEGARVPGRRMEADTSVVDDLKI